MRNEPKSTIINKIIKENKYKSYLEIGYQLGVNFDKIKCKNKLAVDPFPMKDCANLYISTSDDFFSKNDRKYKRIFDIILIDGSHLCEQVRQDIINASKCLSKYGCIILHDVLPQKEEHQTREVTAEAWCGDVWRAYIGLINNNNDLGHVTHNTDWGVAVIYPNGIIYDGQFENLSMTFDDFLENRDLLLNVK